MMQRLKLVLAFDGTRYQGWQIQAGTQGRTVQAVLEDAVAKLAGQPVRVQGSSRTDSGVHALGLVAHVDIPANRSGLPWRKALNAHLPHDICVVEAAPVPDTFHARFGAKHKTYAYVLWHDMEFVFPQRRKYVWRVGKVDFAAMEDVAAVLVGEKDFSAFQNQGSIVKDTVRKLVAVTRCPGQSEFESVWRFTGTGFLKQMVRNMVGCLVAAGKGKLCAEDVEAILLSKNRALAPPTAPSKGLTLESIVYDTSP